MSSSWMTTLERIRSKYEAIICQEGQGTRDLHRIDRELSMLMSELEREFEIPLLEKNLKAFQQRYPEVVALYRQISNARNFDLQ